MYHIHGTSDAGFREAGCSCLRHRPSVDQLWSLTDFARPPMSHLLDQQGFAVVPHVLTTSEREQLIESLGPVTGAGRRGLLALPIVAQLARSSRLLDIVRPHLPADPRPVRAIYFDKVPETNWLVAWHQDLTLALRARVDAPGFGPWSVKDGVPHVQAPVHLLEQMLTTRLHLDDCDETNGALRVLPGSHRLGRLSAERIRLLRKHDPDHLCHLSAGDALLMRPLLLHASSRSQSNRHRRVLHIEYAAFPLPDPLEWHEAEHDENRPTHGAAVKPTTVSHTRLRENSSRSRHTNCEEHTCWAREKIV